MVEAIKAVSRKICYATEDATTDALDATISKMVDIATKELVDAESWFITEFATLGMLRIMVDTFEMDLL